MTNTDLLREALEECDKFLGDLTDPDRKASGPNIVATFGNALVLRRRVLTALSQDSIQVGGDGSEAGSTRIEGSR